MNKEDIEDATVKPIKKDLDDYIQYWKTIKYDNLYLIMSLSFPNPTKHFKGLI
jgi:hypothetical protein